MQRNSAAGRKRLASTAGLVGWMMLAPWMALTVSTAVHAQGPALTTVSEVRYSDMAWGIGNNRNLIGRFTSSTFTLPRYGRAQAYFLRSYDNSAPARYSRYSTALFVDYPL